MDSVNASFLSQGCEGTVGPDGTLQNRMHTREMQCYWCIVFLILLLSLVTGLIKHVKLTEHYLGKKPVLLFHTS